MSTISRNILGGAFGITKTNVLQTVATRVHVLVVATLAFGFGAMAETTLVGLQLTAYTGITPLFPGVVLSLAPRHPSASGNLTGIAALAAFALSATATGGRLNIRLAAFSFNIV